MGEIFFIIENPAQLRICISRALATDDNELYVRAIAKFKWQHYYMESSLDWTSEVGEEIVSIFHAMEMVYPPLNAQVEDVIDDEMSLAMAVEEVSPNLFKKLFK